MTGRSTWLGGVLLFATGAGAAWLVRGMLVHAPAAEEEPGAEAAEVDPGDMEVAVTTAEARLGDLPLTVAAAGVVRADPQAEITLSSRAHGVVLEVKASPGLAVKKGALLFRFDHAPLEATLLEARSALTQASNALDDFERNGRERQLAELRAAAQKAAADAGLADAQLARLEPLRAEGLVSGKALSEAKEAAAQARREKEAADRALAAFEQSGSGLEEATLKAAHDSAAAALREAETVLAGAEVVAPKDGRIVEVLAKRGQSLDAGAPLGTILVEDARVVSFGVTPRDAASLEPGAPASWEGADGTPRTGTVARIVDEVSPATGLVEVVVLPDPGTPPAPPGLVVTGEIERGRLKGVVLVPEEAVIRSADRLVVVVATPEGRARVTPVSLLGRHGGAAGVQGDVHAGDRVIVKGGYNLPDGARITVEPGGDR